MSLFNILGGEFIEIIEWTDDSRDTMVYRFPTVGNAIKYGAKLTVREGQAAVFIHEGQLADVFAPGLYMLETNNLPVLTRLQHWDHGFKSPFKSEIYFVNTTRFNDLKWGTKNPVIARDPEFGPVRLRAFGTYSMRVTDPGKFMQEIVGTDGEFTADEISFQLRNIIVQEFSRMIAASGIPVLDMAANTQQFGQLVAKAISPTVASYGLTIPEFYIENISLPDEVEKALEGAVSGSADGGVSADALGAILTWMQDRTSPAFVIMTANDPSKLPPEFLRKGRFDEIWWIDLPTTAERIAIVEATLRGKGRDPHALDLDFQAIAEATEGFTGAEIAAVIKRDAMFTAFLDGQREIVTNDVLMGAKDVIPLARTSAEKIARLRETWAGRARPATRPEAGQQSAFRGGVRQIDL